MPLGGYNSGASQRGNEGFGFSGIDSVSRDFPWAVDVEGMPSIREDRIGSAKEKRKIIVLFHREFPRKLDGSGTLQSYHGQFGCLVHDLAFLDGVLRRCREICIRGSFTEAGQGEIVDSDVAAFATPDPGGK